MDLSPLPVESVIGAFLLSFPALFSIVNPVGAALIFNEVTAGRSEAERHRMAGRIGLYSAIVLLVSLWLGGYVLNFFGVSLSALRIAGGLVVAVRAWSLLMQPEVHEERKASSAEAAQNSDDDVDFFPFNCELDGCLAGLWIGRIERIANVGVESALMKPLVDVCLFAHGVCCRLRNHRGRNGRG